MLLCVSAALLSPACGNNPLGPTPPSEDNPVDDGSSQETPSDQPKPLVAPDLSFKTAEDTPLAGTLVTDPSANLTFNVVGRPAHGVLAILPDGELSYTPEPDFFGADTIIYEITDGTQIVSGIATINVAPVNDPPTAHDDTAVLTEDATPNAVLGNVLTNDTDIDPVDTQIVTQVNAQSANVGASVTGRYGALLLNADGAYTYTLDNANPTVDALTTGQTLTDAFTYTMQDSGGLASSAELTITIRGVNDVPRPADDISTASEDGPPIGGNLLLNDSDPETPAITVSAVNGDPFAIGNLVASAYGLLQVLANGSYVYTVDNTRAIVQALPQGQTVIELFTYTITDGVNQASAKLTITVTGTNDAPTAQGDGTYRVADGQSLQIPAGTLLANDSDPDTGDTLTAVLDTPPSKAAAFALNADGSFTYTHDGSGPGNDSFTYHAEDASGAASNSATVQIEIQAGVGANNDSFTINQGATLDVTIFQGLLTNDTGTAPLAVTHYGPVGGPLITLPSAVFTTTNNALLIIKPDGSLSYVPDPAFSGTDSFAYAVSNAVSSATATVTITVQRPPTAKDDNPGALYTTAVGVPLTRPDGDLFADHGAGPDDLGFPSATVFLFSGSLGDFVSVTPAGGFTFSSNTSGKHTFSYSLANPAGVSTGIVTVTVTQSPTARSDPQGGLPADTTPPGGARPHPYHTAFNTLLSVTASPNGLLANDNLGFPIATVKSFGVTGTETLVVSGDTANTTNNGTVRVLPGGNFFYIPPAGFTGYDTFKYALGNGAGPVSITTVTVAVGVRPDVADDSRTVTKNTSLDTATGTPFSILTNDIGDALTAALVSVTHGTATVRANGTFTFTPETNYTGPAAITYTATNGFGSAQGFIHLTITNPP